MDGDWLAKVRDTAVETRRVQHDGCPIQSAGWPSEAVAGRGLLFLHGRNANLHWWALVAPHLRGTGRCVAMDFSGAGDSGRRAQYSLPIHAAEVMAVAQAWDLDRPVLVAHSFGGFVAIQAVVDRPDRFGGLVIVDSPLAKQAAGNLPEIAPRPKRHYPDRATILARFRLLPEQAAARPELLAYLAENAVRHEPEGWCWKFDGAGIDRSRSDRIFADLPAALERLPGPVAFIAGSDSRLIGPADHSLARGMSPKMTTHAIAGAAHHIMVDRPRELADLLRQILAPG